MIMTPRKSILELRKANNYMDDEGMYAEGMLALLLRLCRWAGVAPLSVISTRAGWRFQLSATMSTLQTIVMTAMNLTMGAGLLLDFWQPPDLRIRAGETVLQAFVWVSDLVLVMAIASLVCYRGPGQMRSLQRVLTQLQQIKFDLNMSSPPAKTEKVKSLAMAITLIWMVLVMFSDFVVYCFRARFRGTTWPIMLFYAVYYISDLLGTLALLQWACTARAVNEAAAALNTHLHQLLNGSEHLSLPTHAVALVRRLALSHERISEIMRQMNDTNGLFLMATLMSTFLRLVLTPYYILVPQTTSEASGLALSLNWTLVLMTNLILTIEPCHWTHAQREQTAILLGQLIVYQAPKCERLSKELDQFAKQLMLSNASFATLGVYTLDRPLMATVLGGVTTYLVIIIQFQTISNQI